MDNNNKPSQAMIDIGNSPYNIPFDEAWIKLKKALVGKVDKIERS